jgi:hypothetical protein
MPPHDWTSVDAGIFHHFHHAWIDDLARALNRGILPSPYYALAEQIAGGLGPDVLTLQEPSAGSSVEPPSGAVALAADPPKVRFRVRAEQDRYAAKAKAVVIHHKSNHQVVAMVEIVSPGNKSARHALRAFVKKAVEAIDAGVHLLIVDSHPPGPRDPQGIHRAIWDELSDDELVLPPDRRLTAAAYIGAPCLEAFIEPFAVGQTVPEMPLFLTPELYIRAPLEAAYASAWEAVPSYWRRIVEEATDLLLAGKGR